MFKITDFIRWALTLLLIYGAYTETGIFTAISLLLIAIALELQGYINNKIIDYLKGK